MTDDKRDELRRRIREHLEARRRRTTPPIPPPRYDEVFFAGTAWLDRIARGEKD